MFRRTGALLLATEFSRVTGLVCAPRDNNYEVAANPVDPCDKYRQLELGMTDRSALRSPDDESLDESLDESPERRTRRLLLLGVESGLLAGQVEGFSRKACNAIGQFGKEDNKHVTRHVRNHRQTQYEKGVGGTGVARCVHWHMICCANSVVGGMYLCTFV